MLHFFQFHHDVANFWLGIENDHIFALELFTDCYAAQQKLKQRYPNATFHTKLTSEAENLGERIWRFDASIPVKPKGTTWLQQVWQAARTIPVGSVISYEELATKAGNPAACRAAATAMRLNPIPVIIPCHRVIRKNGDLGGFSAGLEYKKRLIAFEKSLILKC